VVGDRRASGKDQQWRGVNCTLKHEPDIAALVSDLRRRCVVRRDVM